MLEVKVGAHRGSVLSPLIFIVVLGAISRAFRVGLPWELLYADDLALAAETEVLDMLKRWTDGMGSKGFRVNIGKTKVMKCHYRCKWITLKSILVEYAGKEWG